MGYLQTLVEALADDGLVLPAPVGSFLKGKAQPLALETRDRLADWCAAHGYSDEQQRRLNKLIGTLVTRDRYLRAVASGSSRVDLDGVDARPVSEADRENAVQKLAVIEEKRMQSEPAAQPPEPVPESVPEPEAPPVAALQALASAFDAALDRPARKSIARAPVVEFRKRRSLEQIDGKGKRTDLPQPTDGDDSKLTQREAADAGPIQRLSMAPPLPASVVRQAVEHANNRRNALRLIAVYLKAGNHAAIAAERSAWVAEASDALATGGHDRDRAEKQVVVMVDVMLTGVAPRAAWPPS